MGGSNATKPVSTSIKEMLDNVIDKYKENDNGGFYNYNGNKYGW